MEPVDYLKVLQRHWKVAAALVVLALAAVYLVAPAKSNEVYEATHTLLRDEASADEESMSSADNANVVSLWAVKGEVPARVAERLAFGGPIDDLTDSLTVIPDIDVNTVELTATADSPEEAVAVVNTFAEELLAFIDERSAADAAEGETRAEELTQRIADLAPVIDAGGEAAVTAQAEADQATNELSAIATEASGGTEWESLQVAQAGRLQDDFVTGATTGQRMLLAGIVAALLGFGVAIMLDRSDSRLHTKEQTERQFGLPVLAEVPLLSMRVRHRAAVYGYQNDSRLAEAYRSLRTALLLFRDRLPLEVEAAELSGRLHGRNAAQASSARQVILVTSPEAGDGKSSTAANLAMAYAEAGQSVLLVNWDLWRPIPARVFDAEDAPGVSEFLEAGNASLVGFVQSTSVPGLHLVPAGKLGHQPGAQLDAELRLLEEARSLADVVIIDTAPLLAASVTRELVTMADVVVLSSRAGRTTSPAAERTAELLERLGAPTLGVVLVGVATGMFADYYGNPPSRADRLRNSVRSRAEPRSASRDEPRREPRYANPRSHGDEPADVLRTSGSSSSRLPGRGIDT